VKDFIFKCVKCGNILDEENMLNVCEECDEKEIKEKSFAKRSRTFKKIDSNKMTHRTKKRQTKPRKEEKTNE
jgi:predicted  nucleic acid-binding Zn-ribbon protein